MKVLLLEDQKKLGRKGEIVEIADAYAMNAVIPKGIGKVATPDIIAQAARDAAAKNQQSRAETVEAEKTSQKLDGAELTLSQKAQDNKLFGAVKMEDVADLIKQSYNMTIEAKCITASAVIKTIGDHALTVDCGHGQRARMTLHVIEN